MKIKEDIPVTDDDLLFLDDDDEETGNTIGTTNLSPRILATWILIEPPATTYK